MTNHLPLGNSCDQSPIKINFKKAHYWRPDDYNDSDMGDGTGFEDFLIADLDTFTEQETLNQQNVPTKK